MAANSWEMRRSIGTPTQCLTGCGSRFGENPPTSGTKGPFIRHSFHAKTPWGLAGTYFELENEPTLTIPKAVIVEEFQMKILAFLSDEGPHFNEEFIEHVGEESEIESAVEHLVVNGHIVSSERGSWVITEEGLEAYNEQLEKDD